LDSQDGVFISVVQHGFKYKMTGMPGKAEAIVRKEWKNMAIGSIRPNNKTMT